MGNPETALTRLGRRLSEEQEALLGRRAHDADARERFVEAALALRAARRPAIARPALGAAALAALAALAACALLVVLGRRPLTLQIGAGEAARVGDAGAWIATPPGQAIPLRFSDGTSFQLEPETKVRVASVASSGARIVLEDGAVQASVVHRPGARWLVDSGPFEVLVTGTRFDVRWSPATEELVVTLAEGSVAVSGPFVGDGLAVRAGQTLRVLRRQASIELRDSDAPDSPPPRPSTSSDAARIEVPAPVDPARSPDGAPPVPGAAPPPPPRAAAPPHAARPSWRELSASGKFKEALAAAEREGFAGLCDTGNAADLRSLADAARLAGDAPRAIAALTALRRRFPGDEHAAEAAFLLGVIAFDAQGEHARSARWFRAYLDERPRGRLAREAAGRLIEALERSRSHAEAQEAARRYLKAYPSGPHAEMAKAIAGE
ncbi:FecR domain-containing protein [Sorangium cellulosum]|uniref:FecR domain-containing protein n=1 Tax=Sorangium cellulosum TaxID=56 RepID=UPI0003F783C7|nr:FecR domain-containing protein [Sorangium cellulosum]